MISLCNTTETLVLDTRNAVSLDVVISYADLTTSTLAANGTQASVTTAANTTILTAPAAATQRKLLFLSVRNRDSVTAQTFIHKAVSGTNFQLTNLMTIKAGESVHYDDAIGWVYYDWNGKPRRLATGPNTGEGPVRGPNCQFVNTIASVREIPTGCSVATYMGRAPKTTNRVAPKFRLTTTTAAVTWGEIAVATGSPSLGNAVPLTVVGVSTANNPLASSWTAGTTLVGIYSTMIDTAPGFQITEGDDIWILFSNSATTPAQLRASPTADDMSSGVTLQANTQPSLNIGVPVTYNLDGNANLPLHIVMTYY